MSVNSISGTASTSQSDTQGKLQQVREDVLSAVASQMGESESDLQSAMSGGQSLAQLAQAKGISSDQLQSTIEGVVKKDMPNASPAQIANVTGRMMNHAHGHHGHHQAQVEQPDDTTDTDSGIHVIA